MSGRLKGALPYAVLFLGAAYLYHGAGAFAATGRPGQLGPDVWPRSILVLLMVVCAFEMVRGALFVRAAADGEEAQAGAQAQAGAGAAPKPPHEEERRYPALLAGGIGLTVLYVPGIQILGFFLATSIYLALFMLIGRYRRGAVIAATSVLGSLAFVYVFMKVVYVSLPLGVGPFKQVSAWIMAALGIH